jgi:hypothetical protein
VQKREILEKSIHLYRLLDQTNYSKSMDQLMTLLGILDCEVDFVVKRKKACPGVPVAL